MHTEILPSFPIPVTRTVLDNGLTVITAEMPTMFARAQVVIRAGSMQDDPLYGIAHFLEHMIYEGPAREGIHPRLRRFVRKGLKANAGTGQGEMFFHTVGLGPVILDALSDLLTLVFEPAFTEALVQKECGVIRQEIRQRDTGQEYNRWRAEKLFSDYHRLHTSIAGTDASVQKITNEHLHAFHQRWFQTENTAIIVTGGIKHLDVIEVVEHILLPNNKCDIVPVPKFYPVIRDLVFEDARTESSVEVFLRPPEKKEDVYLLGIGFNLLGHSVVGNLKCRLRQEAGEIYSLGKRLPNRMERLAGIQIPCRPSIFGIVEIEMRESLHWLREGIYSEEAWETVITDCYNGALSNLEDMQQGSANGLWNELRDKWFREDICPEPTPEQIRAIRPEDIARLFQTYATEDKLGVVRVLPPHSTP